MSQKIPAVFFDMFSQADASWQPILHRGLEEVERADSNYLSLLAQDTYLPTQGRLFAAFAQPLDAVKYVLAGEGPYPREQSATGVCFMDGAVELLWSDKGLSKQVNRATSLRNFVKMLLVADGQLAPDATSGEALSYVSVKARGIGTPYIQTLKDLQKNLTEQGFLLLNASLVFRPHVAPIKDAKAWMPFLNTVLMALADRADQHHQEPATLVLWGKIAEQLKKLPSNNRLPQIISEHPYNLSFINNSAMQSLFAPMQLLMR